MLDQDSSIPSGQGQLSAIPEGGAPAEVLLIMEAIAEATRLRRLETGRQTALLEGLHLVRQLPAASLPRRRPGRAVQRTETATVPRGAIAPEPPAPAGTCSCRLRCRGPPLAGTDRISTDAGRHRAIHCSRCRSHLAGRTRQHAGPGRDPVRPLELVAEREAGSSDHHRPVQVPAARSDDDAEPAALGRRTSCSSSSDNAPRLCPGARSRRTAWVVTTGVHCSALRPASGKAAKATNAATTKKASSAPRPWPTARITATAVTRPAATTAS